MKYADDTIEITANAETYSQQELADLLEADAEIVRAGIKYLCQQVYLKAGVMVQQCPLYQFCN